MTDIAYLGSHSASVDLTTDQIIERAIKSDLSGAMIIGTRQDGSLYFETSVPDGCDALWLLEKVKHLILSESFHE
jgi:hypothetical protein